jgi:hypothetical protein
MDIHGDYAVSPVSLFHVWFFINSLSISLRQKTSHFLVVTTGLQGLGTKEKDVFSTQFEEICVSASDIISKNSFLPSTLVGAFGEGSVMPALRLVSTVAENGHCKRVNQQLVRSGVLTPLTDMLRDAMNSK